MTPAVDFPLSHEQFRVWFLDELQAAEHGFADHRLFRVDGRLDLTALRFALDRLTARHEPLRTAYLMDHRGELVQRIHDPGHIPISELQAADQAEGLSIAAVLARERFDLGTLPLARFFVIRLGDDSCLLLLTFHLLVLDAWGLEVLCRELSAVYGELMGAATAVLPGLPIQYVDWAAWQRGQLTEQRLTECLKWWRSHLDGYARLLGLPVREKATVGSSATGKRLYRTLDAGSVISLQRFAQAEKTTVYTILAAIYAVVLGRHSHQQRFLFGTPVANRERPETQNLLGFFVDPLIITADLAGEPTFREVLHRISEATMASHRHHELPFDRLVAGLAEPRAPARDPLLQAYFVYRPHGSLGRLKLFGCRTVDIPLDVQRTRFEFTLRIDETPTTATVCAEFDSALFAPDFVAVFLDDYLTTLHRALADPDARPLGPAQERPTESTTHVATTVDSLAMLKLFLKLRAQPGNMVTLRDLLHGADDD